MTPITCNRELSRSHVRFDLWRRLGSMGGTIEVHSLHRSFPVPRSQVSNMIRRMQVIDRSALSLQKSGRYNGVVESP